MVTCYACRLRFVSLRDTKSTHTNGKFHRSNGPAIERWNNQKESYFRGFVHKDLGPTVIYPQGSKFYYVNNKFHRIDGPAIELINGDKEWWLYGLRHRIDGPAVERSNGDKFNFFCDVQYDEDSEIMIDSKIKEWWQNEEFGIHLELDYDRLMPIL